ncbi:MAG: hypothetical protein GFH27_549289n165 [Chloroflexi bacterium AL-W]|nr:hypothetical protein [Chloroflexi bacterium AL-N1]NOK66898.1 hypothetical protein [Chloroflexi bacterium AL-N10]NOK74810.1 hypothetical protein [Chloroflexi bacterium AL-N5]NOK81500.1 hypothetical protein [Chloroflexi bacterium AL-W]NOK88970.1 hypothetical protein [Chloroflexi bacterium AL-N15]
MLRKSLSALVAIMVLLAATITPGTSFADSGITVIEPEGTRGYDFNCDIPGRGSARCPNNNAVVFTMTAWKTAAVKLEAGTCATFTLRLQGNGSQVGTPREICPGEERGLWQNNTGGTATVYFEADANPLSPVTLGGCFKFYGFDSSSGCD